MISRCHILSLIFCLVFGFSTHAFAQRTKLPTPLPDAGDTIENSDNDDEEVIEGEEEVSDDTPVTSPSRATGTNSQETEINVKNADIAAIVRIFSKKTRRNYLMDESVRGKVSIYLPGRVNEEESLQILDSVLALKGFTSVPVAGNTWKIVPSKDAKQTTIPTITDDSQGVATSAMVTRLVHLKYVAADEIKQIIAPLVSPDGLLNAYTGTNALIIIDNRDNINRLIEIVSTLDVPFANREMTIVPIKYADSAEIATKLNEILGTSNSGGGAVSQGDDGMDLVRARAGDVRNAATAALQNAQLSAASRTVAAKGRDPRIIADERTNSIIILADDDTTARVKALISQLDSKIDLSGRRFYVYRCQHAKAEDLADVLSGLVGGSGGSTSASRTTGSGDESTANRTTRSSRNQANALGNNAQSQRRLRGQQRTPGNPRASGAQGGAASVQLGDDLSITADPATNSLIINGSKTDYEKVVLLLADLDIKRRQVLVEAMLLEVGINDDSAQGFEFLSSAGGKDGGLLMGNTQGNLARLLQDPTQVQNFSLAAASAGSLTLPNGIIIPTQSVLLNAVQSNSNVNVLSAPTILTTDNEEAEIIVGQNVPFVSSTSRSQDNLNNTFNQVDRQDVGITLRLTPQISSGDFVTLKLFTEVSNVVQETATSTLGPTTSLRTSQTTVIAKNGQMIVTGGLMADDINQASTGVPFLKNIPVLGQLFRNDIERHRRTNLLIFITPRIVEDQFDARDATVLHRDKIEGVLERNEINPPRREILENPDIDKVAEIKTWTGTKPSTITGPRQPDKSPSAGTNKALEILVAPRFVEKTAPRVTPLKAQERYVVLSVFGPKEKQKDIPWIFPTNASQGGIILPPESFTKVGAFFTPGSRIGYKLGDTVIPVEVTGTFLHPSDLKELSIDVANWYTLSPHEILNMGKAPWVTLK